jgi:hypothetical protein
MEIEKDGTDNAEPKYNIDYLVNLMYYDLWSENCRRDCKAVDFLGLFSFDEWINRGKFKPLRWKNYFPESNQLANLY